jgi:hypothetical protein
MCYKIYIFPYIGNVCHLSSLAIEEKWNLVLEGRGPDLGHVLNVISCMNNKMIHHFLVLWFHNEVDQLWLCHFIQKTVICSTIWNPIFFLQVLYDSDSHYTVEGWLKCLCFAFVWCLFVTVSPHVHLAFITNKVFSQPKVFDYNSFFGTELRNSCW